MTKSLIAYYRVSTQQQGRSGLGLDAQRKAVAEFAASTGNTVTAEFTEIESGKREDRPALAAALAACKKQKATLVIAKLDRLARKLSMITSLQDSKVDFVACDNPHATKFTVQILGAVAELERDMISDRTKAGLAMAKARGVQLGNAKQAGDNRTAAVERALALGPVFAGLAGQSARAIARELNARKIATPTGAPWSARTVIRVQERLAA
jgi:DNA invertase Pin-like site-specific DNA recombinase